MDDMLRKDIERFVSENEEAIFADIAKLVSYNSENGPALPGKPFGEGPAAALEAALGIARGMGLAAENCEVASMVERARSAVFRPQTAGFGQEG